MTSLIVFICLAGLLASLVGGGLVTILVGLYGEFKFGPIRLFRPRDDTFTVVITSTLGLLLTLTGLAVPMILLIFSMTGQLSLGDFLNPPSPQAVTEADILQATTASSNQLSDQSSTLEVGTETIPTATLILTRTPTAEPQLVTVRAGVAQVRSGPSYAFDTESFTANQGAEVFVIGANEDRTWFLVESPGGEGWMSGRDLDFGPVDRASILPADPIPRLPEADSTPRILTITGGEEVPVAGSSPVMSFLDAENDVVEVAMEPVVGRFETFTIRVLGVPEIAFDLFDCGQQTVTLAATPTDQGGNVGPTVYFSFECVP